MKQSNQSSGGDSRERLKPAVSAGYLSPFWWFVLALGGLVGFLSLTAGATEGSTRELATFGVVSSVVALLCVRYIYPTRESSASFLFLLCFSLFNLGLAPFVALGIHVPTFGLSTYDTLWLYSSAFPRALALSTVGLLSLLVGTTLGRILKRGENRRAATPEATADRDALALQLGFPGAILMGSTVLAFFAIALTHGGPGIFASGYATWSSSTQGTPLPYVYALLGFGAGILAISTKSQARTIGFLFFVTYAIPALLVGLRGEVLFPVVAAVVMAGFRSPVLNGKRFLVLLAVVLLGVSGIRTFRDAGFANTTSASGPSTSVTFSALDGLAEMGYSLRPTVVVVQWQEQGQHPLDGASFESPFLRQAHNVLPGLGPNAPSRFDPNILNSVVLQRVGPIGFSQTAEGYDNWGTSGVVGFLLLLGLTLSWIDRGTLKVSALLVRNSVFVPLLIEVRNTFTPVPTQILLGLVISFVAIAMAKRRVGQKIRDRVSYPTPDLDFRNPIDRGAEGG